MVLEIDDVKNGSCNFCSKGKLVHGKDRPRLVYPYEKFLTISRDSHGSVCVNICKECLDELIEKSKRLEF